MAPNSLEKREFLGVYDYGMGGIWYVILAESIKDVQRRFPFFKVFDSPPKFITKDDLSRIRIENFQDIDQPDSNYLSIIRDEWNNSNYKALDKGDKN